MAECQRGLQKLFGTQEPIVTLTSSGTGGMEAVIRSCLQPSDKVLAVNAGKFGERFLQLTDAFGLKVDELKLPWGKSVSVSALKKALKPEHTCLLIQHSETSTGTLHPLSEIAAWLKKEQPKTLLFVDAITSIGALPFQMDEWGVDATVTGSQKALMLPPGLSFVALSPRARKRAKTPSLPGFYFDLNREFESQVKGQTGFTPSVSLIVALKESLRLLEEEGLSHVFERHQKLAAATRHAVVAMGLELASELPSVACTAIKAPEGVKIKEILKTIEETHGFRIAGAQGEWEGKAFRISHLGYYSPFDLLSALTALGGELGRAKVKVDLMKALKVFIDELEL